MRDDDAYCRLGVTDLYGEFRETKYFKGNVELWYLGTCSAARPSSTHHCNFFIKMAAAGLNKCGASEWGWGYGR